MHIKTRRGRGGVVERVTIRDVTLLSSDAALWISTRYPGESQAPDAGQHTPTIREIVLERARGACKRGVDARLPQRLQKTNAIYRSSTSIRLVCA